VRRQACGRLDDQKLLAQIATDDASAEVRSTALDEVKDQKLLAQIARNAPDAWERLVACRRVYDKGLLAQLAADASDAEVCIEAFSKAFDQLVNNHEFCRKAVQDSITEMNSRQINKRYSQGLDILVRIAAHDPGLIRQFWPQIEHACHEDDPNSHHFDRYIGSDCGYEDHPEGRGTPHHRDKVDRECQEKFPAAVKS
jgi:hypothetical protein